MVNAIDTRKKAAGSQEINKLKIDLYGLHVQIHKNLSGEEEFKNLESIENLYVTPKGFDSFSGAFNYW